MEIKTYLIGIYAINQIMATITYSALAVAIFSINRKAPLNRIFTYTVTLGAYMGLTTLMVTMAENLETACLWNKIGFLSPFFIVMLLHFIMIFVREKSSLNKREYAILYLPGLFFSILNLLTDEVSGIGILGEFGYRFQAAESIIGYSFTIWSTIITFSTVLITLIFAFKTDNKRKKQQATLISIGLIYPIILGLLSNAAMVLFGWDIPYYGAGGNSVLCVVVAFAIWKYGLFNLNPAITLEKIITTIPDAFILIDSNGEVLKINEALMRLTGYKECDLIGKKVDSLFDNEFKQNFNECTQKNEKLNFELKINTNKGILKSIEISSTIIKNKKGKKLGNILIIHDLSRRKADQEKIIKNERLAAIGELAGMVGHDLRNPLNSIQTATYYLKKKCPKKVDHTFKEMLDSIQTGVQYSNKIIEDLLDYSREMKLEIEQTTPKKLTDFSLTLIRIPENVRVINLSQNDPIIRVDKVRMSRVFVNLIKNAFDAMPDGGTLKINSTKTSNDVEISFKDTGTGISQETIEKIWRPLFTTKAKGMGFGLSICKRIVEAHYGNIQVESIPGKETIFTVTIPFIDRPDML